MKTKTWILLGIITVLGLSIRLSAAFSYDLFFDESATWAIAANSSWPDLLLGKYADEGNPPLAYIIYKPLLLLTTEEALLRIPAVLTGVAAGLVLTGIFMMETSTPLALLGALLIMTSPALVFYSSELRFYSFGFLLQCCSLWLFLMGWRKEPSARTRYIIASAIMLCASLFTVFSSAYLIPYYLLYLILLKRDGSITKTQRFLYGGLCMAPGVIFAVWLIQYVGRPESGIALRNYVAYGDTFFVDDLILTLKNLTVFIPDWTGDISPDRLTGLFRQGLVRLSLLPPALLLLQLLAATRRKTERATKELVLLFFVLLTMACGISLTGLNVLSIKLLLILYLPFVGLILVLISSTAKYARPLGLVLSMGVLALNMLTLLFNTGIHRYQAENAFATLMQRTNPTCTHLIVSHQVAYNVLNFYSRKHRSSLTGFQTVLINYKDSASLERSATALAEIHDEAACPYLAFLQYYNDWPTDSTSYKIFRETLKQYMPVYVSMTNNHQFGLTLYEKRNPSPPSYD